MRCIRFLSLALLAAILVFLSIGYFFTYRYPGLRFDPVPLSTELNSANVQIKAHGAYVKSPTDSLFRAFQPSVSFTISATKQATLSFVIENIHPLALVSINKQIPLEEKKEGLTRTLYLELPNTSTAKINFNFPQQDSYRFGVIGDTGGDTELSWGLQRLASQEVDFILHLGDGYYTPNEVGKVQIHFNSSEIPVYATNGNHDFHHGRSGLTVETYMRNIGPLNNRFRLLNHCFINLETGGFMFPTHGGQRGDFLREAVSELTTTSKDCKPIIFTHKPILSSLDLNIPQVDHTLNGYDARWILKQLHKLSSPIILAGHIHKDFEFTQGGIKTYVTGSGLAQDDLLTQRHVAKLLIGEISADGELNTHWIKNEMPIEYHCSTKVRNSLQKETDKKTKGKFAQLINKLSAACDDHGDGN